MGFFDRLFPRKPTRPPKPEVISDDPDSPYLAYKDGADQVTVTDRDTFDYLFGDSTAPDPAQADLDEVLLRTRQVRVLAGGLFRGEPTGRLVLAECSEPAALAQLPGLLRIVTDPATFRHCACFGGPVLELLDGEQRLTCIGLQHGQAVRWTRWRHDARLAREGALDPWLKARGVDPGLLNDIYHNQLQPLSLFHEGPPALSALEQRLLRVAYQAEFEPQQALATCDCILRETPRQAVAYALRAHALDKLGDQAGCLAALNAAIELGLRRPSVYFCRAVCLDSASQHREAILDCDRALALDPTYANAYNSRGLIQGQLGRQREALADLAEAIRLAPRWALPHLNRGQLHQLARDFRAALADYDRALQLARDDEKVMDLSLKAVLHMKRAQCHGHLGDAERCAAEHRVSLELDPGIAILQQARHKAQA